MNLSLSLSLSRERERERELSDRGLCDELITCREESYRLWCIVVCDLEISWIRRPWSAVGRSPANKKFLTKCLHTPGLPQWHVLSVLQDDNQPSDGLFHHKPIDLEKLFTPASDSGEATPSRNSKFLASAPWNCTFWCVGGEERRGQLTHTVFVDSKGQKVTTWGRRDYIYSASTTTNSRPCSQHARRLAWPSTH